MLSCFGRKGLWYVWGFNAVIASIFSIVAVSHGAVLDKIIVNNKAANSILDAAIAGITCAVFLNICYLIVTSLILLRKTLALNGAGATYGFMVAMSLMMFFNQVQVGFCLQSIHPWIEESIGPAAGKHWKSSDDTTHDAVVALAYLSAATYIVLTFVLFCGSGGLQKSMIDDGPRAIELEGGRAEAASPTPRA